jgi:hypothetical protein
MKSQAPQPDAMPPRQAGRSHAHERKRFYRGLWAAILLIGVALALAVNFAGEGERSPPNRVEPYTGDAPQTSASTRVTLLANLAAARELTPRTELVAISVAGSLPDGTVDLEHGGVLSYTFRSKQGEGPQPRPEEGSGGQLTGMFCGQQGVRLDRKGLRATLDAPKVRCDPLKETLPPPDCSLRQLWQVAGRRGVKAPHARIEYYWSNAGPAWRFLPSGGKPFAIGADCKTVLSAADAKYRQRR